MAAKAQVDLSEFFKLSKPKSPPCQIGLILDRKVTPKLPGEEIEQLQAALAEDSGAITSGAIVAWLASRKVESNPVRVSNHRNGICRCKREA